MLYVDRVIGQFSEHVDHCSDGRSTVILNTNTTTLHSSDRD